jgi:mannose-6-phosphate isomerase
MATLPVLRLEPQLHERVWGGQRLQAGSNPIGEAWVVHEANRVAGGRLDGLTLRDVTLAHGAELLGEANQSRFRAMFPLLIKLIDTSDWLSIQVHPDDVHARSLEGPNAVGKTEAWHILEAEPESRLIAGLGTALDMEGLGTAVRDGTIIDHVRYQTVQEADTLFIPPGAIHALGPGLFIYEVQQSSDITYRVFDWHRPTSDNRPLHLDESLAVLDAGVEVSVMPDDPSEGAIVRELVSCRYFLFESIDVGNDPVQADTGGATFHALTSVAGSVTVSGDGWSEQLDRYQSLLVPASVGPYMMAALEPGRVLRASVPASNDWA